MGKRKERQRERERLKFVSGRTLKNAVKDERYDWKVEMKVRSQAKEKEKETAQENHAIQCKCKCSIVYKQGQASLTLDAITIPPTAY